MSDELFTDEFFGIKESTSVRLKYKPREQSAPDFNRQKLPAIIGWAALSASLFVLSCVCAMIDLVYWYLTVENPGLQDLRFGYHFARAYLEMHQALPDWLKDCIEVDAFFFGMIAAGMALLRYVEAKTEHTARSGRYFSEEFERRFSSEL